MHKWLQEAHTHNIEDQRDKENVQTRLAEKKKKKKTALKRKQLNIIKGITTSCIRKIKEAATCI